MVDEKSGVGRVPENMLKPGRGAIMQGAGGYAFPGSQPMPKKLEYGFVLVVLAMLFEFGRPQDFIPPLKVIPFPSLIDASLALAVLLSGRASLANRQSKLWIGLLAFMALWIPFANNNFHAFSQWKELTLYFFFYLGIVTFVNNTGRMHKLILVWLGVHALLAINGMLHHGRGVGGWLGDENDFAMEMNVAVPFAFFMYQGTSDKRGKLLYLVLIGVFVLSSISTSSRGGFLGLLAVGLFCWFYSPRKVWSLILLTGVLLLVLVAAPQEYWDRMQTITDDSTMESGTAGQRMFTWGIGWEMFLANPIFGVGQGNFPWTIGEYLGGRTWQTKSLAGRQAHSLYFTLLPELGLLGLFLIGGIALSNYKDVRYCSRMGMRKAAARPGKQVQEDAELEEAGWFGNAILGALVAYLVTSTFISTLYYPTFWILTGLAVALKNTTERYSKKSLEVSSPPVPVRATPWGRPRPVR
ncbi:MAG: O-antigen polymerase [Nitrospira sp.]|jgi:O-antigen ligase|nr:MAG: O-antigen polymerase [Nitrospira sp.]